MTIETPVALVRLDPKVCPDCAARLTVVVYEQPALLRHGGYGATVRTTTRRCPKCSWQLEHCRTEIRPNGYAREEGDG